MDVEHLLSPNMNDIPLIRQVARYHGIELRDETLELRTERADEEWAEMVMSHWRGRSVVLFNHSSHLSEKNLPATIAAETLGRLRQRFTVLELSSDGDLTADSLRFKPTLRQAAALVRRLELVITVDSFPSHLAAAVATPAVVLFGPSNPKAFAHPGQIVLRDASCPPCGDTQRLRECTHYRCMGAHSADLIEETVDAVLTGQ